MTKDNNLLEKVIVSTELGVSPRDGLLSPDQTNQFVDYIFDATVLGQLCRVQRLRADTAEINRIGIGQRLIRAAVEAVDTGENQGVIFSKISLTTSKIRLDWEISTETLEDNIEGNGFEDHVARLMTNQLGQDLEDLAINGDTTNSNASLRIFDGWRKQLLQGNTDGAAHVIDAGGSALNLELGNRALKAMPRRYMANRGGLRFFTSSGLMQDFLYSQATTGGGFPEVIRANVIQNGPVRSQGPAGFVMGNMFGVPVQEVPMFDQSRTGSYSGSTGTTHGELWLTDPQNLIWAVKREVQVYRQFAQKKDSIEYTVYLRVGTAIELTDAAVVVVNVKASA